MIFHPRDRIPSPQAWRPAVLAVSEDPSVLARLARVCLPMEPHARWMAEPDAGRALERLAAAPCDLVLADAAALPPQVDGFVRAARRVWSQATLVLVGTVEAPVPSGVHAVAWHELPACAAFELARLRCRAALQSLDLDDLSATTLPDALPSYG